MTAPATKRELTNWQAKNAKSRSTPSALFQLQPPSENLLAVKARMPGMDQHHQLHSRSSHQRALTNCQAKNGRSRSTTSASFQLQPLQDNLLPVKPRIPGADQHHQLHYSSSHHERTYQLISHKYQEQINPISFIPAPATMRELTNCQAKNGRSRSTPSASFQLQPP
jgi:hypothetical protein